ncbi:uncharacterized protein LOC130547009 [Triplophysa rosa]|uniref:uncharacterized protein LOC130547009 n=1 Tax=Triplophysa rosa TaxID=992332 RepID=UPI0025461E89|nr:uncharacterized protein LOC130547009 [Triplophysa rosa]
MQECRSRWDESADLAVCGGDYIPRSPPPGTTPGPVTAAGGPGQPVPGDSAGPTGGPRGVPELDAPGGSDGGTSGPAPPIHLMLQKMGPHDDPEAFLELYERAAESSEWPRDQWALRLIPLLSGEAQVAAQQLPPESLLVYAELKKAILQRVGRSPEQHRQRFRSLGLAEAGRPYLLAQQLRDSCRKWLVAEGSGVGDIIDKVVLEQFITCLPRKTAGWVQCHRPASLDGGSPGRVPWNRGVSPHGVSLHTAHTTTTNEPAGTRAPDPAAFPRKRPSSWPRRVWIWTDGGGRRCVYVAFRHGGHGYHTDCLGLLTPAVCLTHCRQGGGKVWAGVLALRGPGSLHRSVSSDGGGNSNPGP